MRRVAAVAAAVLLAGAGAAEPPRLAGTVIAPGHRTALFDTGSGVMTQAEEGDDIAGYRVRSIARGDVELERDGHEITLRPSPAGKPVVPVDTGRATFGLVLRAQPQVDD